VFVGSQDIEEEGRVLKKLLDSKEYESEEGREGADLKNARVLSASSCLPTVGWAEGVRLLRLSNLVGA